MSTNAASTNFIQVTIDLSSVCDVGGFPVAEYIEEAVREVVRGKIRELVFQEAREKKHLLEAIVRKEMDRIAWPTAQEVIDNYKKNNNV